MKIVLSATLVAVGLTGRAQGQTDPAEICRGILSDAGNNISISQDSDAVLDTVFDKYCNQSGTAKSSNLDIGLGVVIEELPIKFTLGSSDKQTAVNNFCRNYAQLSTSNHQRSSYQSTVVDKALDTMDDCVRIARTGSFLTHKILNDEAADIYLTARTGDKITIQGLNTTGHITCQTNVKSNNLLLNNGKALSLDGGSRFDFEGNLTISCTRKGDSATADLIATKPADGGPAARTGATVFNEATVSVSTQNAGPYAFLWPRAVRFPENEASQVSADIAGLRDTLSKTNADLAAAKTQINVLQNHNVFGIRGCASHTLPEIDNQGDNGSLLCPAGQYVAGVIRYKYEQQTNGVICCPSS